MKFLTLLLPLTLFFGAYGQPTDTLHLWPGDVPGEAMKKQPPTTGDTSNNVLRLTDITDPILITFEPKAASKNGRAIIIAPGGGYQILAIDLEGYEIAEWFANLGYTAYVLQYRVPNKQAGALNDIQRAVRIVRFRAAKEGIDKDKIGVMGFSAGGSLSARASTLYDKDTYTKVDAADEESCKPNFAVLIYPAYLDDGEDNTLTPELKVNEDTPPMFIFGTVDDPYGNSALIMAKALRDAKVPVEFHFMPNGGHGYGLRPGNPAAAAWPKYLEAWLKSIGTE